MVAGVLGAFVFASGFWLASVAADRVLIELTPADAEAAAQIANSCSEALVSTRCEVHDPNADRQPEHDVALHARVRLSAEQPLQARLEFEEPGGPRAARALEFEERDPPSARMRAIGLVIAAHVLERMQAAQTRSQPEQPAAAGMAKAGEGPPPDAQAEHAAEAADHTTLGRFWLGLGALAGPGLDRGPMRAGVHVQLGARPWPELPLSAVASGRGALRLGSPEVLWSSLGLGGLVELPLGRRTWSLRLSAEVLTQRIDARASDTASGQSEAGHATRVGGAFGLELGLRLGAGVALYGGAELSLFDRLVLEIAQGSAREAPVQIAATAGVRMPL